MTTDIQYGNTVESDSHSYNSYQAAQQAGQPGYTPENYPTDCPSASSYDIGDTFYTYDGSWTIDDYDDDEDDTWYHWVYKITRMYTYICISQAKNLTIVDAATNTSYPITTDFQGATNLRRDQSYDFRGEWNGILIPDVWLYGNGIEYVAGYDNATSPGTWSLNISVMATKTSSRVSSSDDYRVGTHGGSGDKGGTYRWHSDFYIDGNHFSGQHETYGSSTNEKHTAATLSSKIGASSIAGNRTFKVERWRSDEFVDNHKAGGPELYVHPFGDPPEKVNN